MSITFIEEPTPINRELRINILEYALKLEANTNTLLLEILDIPIDVKKKALSGKSGSLSFKNKIDLLFDLEVIANDEHKELILLMEFRNKFLHDLYCNSFEDALSLCGNERKNTLLKLIYGVQKSKNLSEKERTTILSEYDSKSYEEKELICMQSFDKLFERTVDIVKSKIEFLEKSFQEKKSFLKKLAEGMGFYCERYTNFLISIVELSEKHNLPDELIKLIKDEKIFFLSSEEVKKHRQIDASCISLFSQKRRMGIQAGRDNA